MLASATVATSLPAFAAPLPVLVGPSAPSVPLASLRLAPEEAPASVLGLDGKDASTANTLTAALRKAFANRGLSGGEEISLEEMRLTMGCTNDEVACLAEGGRTLGVRRLVFGYLRSSGGGYELDIQILDVASGQLEAQASIPISKAELASDEIDAKATAIVNQLMPADTADSDLPPRTDPLPVDDVEEEPVEEEPKKAKKEGSGVYFGIEKPTPRWKWIAFGTSLGVTLAAAGVTIGTGLWLTAPESWSFGFRPKLIKAAEDSLAEPDAFNRVDPRMTGDLCEYNTTFDDGSPIMNGARNAGVAEVCTRGVDVRRNMIAFGAATAVGGVATLAFLGVLLIHKRKPTADAMLRHGVRLGVAPNLDGQRGLTVAGGMRF